jgi:hypothetical protein
VHRGGGGYSRVVPRGRPQLAQCYAAPIRRHPVPSGAKLASDSKLHFRQGKQRFLNGGCLSRRRLHTVPVEPDGPHLALLATPAGPLESRCVFLGNHNCHTEFRVLQVRTCSIANIAVCITMLYRAHCPVQQDAHFGADGVILQCSEAGSTKALLLLGCNIPKRQGVWKPLYMHHVSIAFYSIAFQPPCSAGCGVGS